MMRQPSQHSIALLLVNFSSLQIAENEQQTPPAQRQIPVVSDIERVKKVIAILEFVGEKVGDILETLPAPQAQEQRSPVENELYEKKSEETSTPMETLTAAKEASPTTTEA